MSTYILAIESSCDDMSVAVMKDRSIISNVTATQISHEQYGGVVPEVASRQHHIDVIPTIMEALSKGGITKDDLNAIAFTQGPGLLGSLIVGVSFAKSLALALDIPMIAIHHMHAHILSHFAEPPYPDFPYLCLTVSGGHTQIVAVHGYNDMRVLGSTIDDAAGEAFDKVGKMLDLPYPAGPIIDKLAQLGTPTFNFSEARVEGLDFSFSGFKTSVLYFLKNQIKENPNFIVENKHNICASVQNTIVNTLVNKVVQALDQSNYKGLAIAGGVAANSGLRDAMIDLGTKRNINIHIPKIQYCTDNAGMVAAAAWFKYQDQDFVDQSITPNARLPF